MPLINHAGGGGGTPQLCGQVENFKVLPGTTALTAALSWTAPSHDEDNSFVGARIVRKTGSAPTGINDGTVVYEGTALTYTDTGLTDGTTYYYRAFAYNAKRKYQTAMRVISFVAISYDTTLANNSWATIHELSEKGYAKHIWSVGDIKPVTINGVISAKNGSNNYSYTYNNCTIDAFILGFNHNASREGNNLIHFMLGKKTGKDVALINCSFGSGNLPNWKNETSRTITLGGNSTPSNPAANSLLAALPADLRAVMKAAKKYYAHDPFTSDREVLYAEDYLSFPGAIELGGGHEPSIMRSYETEYDYFKAGNSVRPVYELLTSGDLSSNSVEYHTRSTGEVSGEWSYTLYITTASDRGPVWYDSDLSRASYCRPIFFV